MNTPIVDKQYMLIHLLKQLTSIYLHVINIKYQTLAIKKSDKDNITNVTTAVLHGRNLELCNTKPDVKWSCDVNAKWRTNLLPQIPQQLRRRQQAR